MISTTTLFNFLNFSPSSNKGPKGKAVDFQQKSDDNSRLSLFSSSASCVQSVVGFTIYNEPLDSPLSTLCLPPLCPCERQTHTQLQWRKKKIKKWLFDILFSSRSRVYFDSFLFLQQNHNINVIIFIGYFIIRIH